MMPGRPGRLIWSRTEKKQKGRVAVAALQGLPSTTDQVLLICANFQVGEKYHRMARLSLAGPPMVHQ